MSYTGHICQGCGHVYQSTLEYHRCPETVAGGWRAGQLERAIVEKVQRMDEAKMRQARDADPINPGHYKSPAGLEAIDVIEAFFDDDYRLASAFKYMARAGKKGSRLEDLRKARWFIERAIAREEKK